MDSTWSGSPHAGLVQPRRPDTITYSDPFPGSRPLTMRRAGSRWVITGTFDDPGEADYTCSRRSDWCGL